MQLKTARHSDLLKLPPDIQDLLYKKSVIPVIDQFESLWNDRSETLLLVGSYGSGKSFFAADMLINRCMNDNYFRCFYGRKVYDYIRGSIFATLVEQIEDHNLEGFSYSKANTSSMIIEYKNGNRFIPFGADKIDKLKSIKEPTHFLLEELDQFTHEDYGMCQSRLGRTSKAQCQFIGMCNTERIYDDHWLYDPIFGENKIGAKIHTSNYRQNTMLPSIEKYEKLLWQRAMGDEDLFNAIANGTPGVRNRANAWIYVAYDISKELIPVIYGNTIYLSFDFNNEPMTCTAWQFSSGRHPMNGEGHFVRAIAEFDASMAETSEEIISLLCNKIKAAFPYHPLRVTGDANGRHRLKGVAGQKSIFTLIAHYLSISEQLLDTPMKDMELIPSRALCNTFMYNHKNVQLSSANTPRLVKDIRNAKADPEKQDQIIKDRASNKNDFFDTFRYIIHTYFNYFLRS